MSVVAKQIDEVVKLGLAPLLKSRGFAKSGRDFHRLAGENWQIVNVQASQGNFGDSGKFTINLGVYLPVVSLLAGEPLRSSKPKEYQCTVCERIGGLMPGGTDHWWAISPSVSLNRIAEEVVSAVERFGLEWLDAHSQVARVAETLRPQPSVMSAAAALAAGDAMEAKRRIDYMATDRPTAATTARAWAKEHGLSD